MFQDAFEVEAEDVPVPAVEHFAMTFQQIAEETGDSINAVQGLYYSAMRKLAQLHPEIVKEWASLAAGVHMDQVEYVN